MNNYYIRCLESDRPALYAAAVALGLLTPLTDGAGYVSARPDFVWDEIGPIYRPAGATTTDEAGNEIPIMTPLSDANGNPYWHCNAYAGFSVGELAAAATDPAVSQAISDIPRFFLTDASGAAIAPAHPARVLAQ